MQSRLRQAGQALVFMPFVIAGSGLSAAAGPGAPAVAAAQVQAVQGRVVDAQTGLPIPFVNVGVPIVGPGTVAGEDGRFVLAGAAADATLAFSAIGYGTSSVAISALPDDGRVALNPADVGYRERLTVTAEAGGEPEVFGDRLEARGFGFGFGSGLLGAELGARIRIKGPTYVESANFTVSHTGGERFLYRVNIYDFSGKEVGANLLKQNVIVTADQERGTLSVDLREQGLVVHDDVLLTLEWIQDDREAGNDSVMFRARPRSRATLYMKPTSQMAFMKVPRIRLGFHLIGYALD